MPDYLFVYGTLRKDSYKRLHPYLEGHAEYIGSASMPGKLYEVDHYPAAIDGPESSTFRIRGEIYRLRDAEALLQTLDEYEECSASFPFPHEYRRCKKTVYLTDALPLEAWVYLYNPPVHRLEWIAHGDYQRYVKERQMPARTNRS